MSNYGTCRKCKSAFADDDRYVVCEGFCQNSAYHSKCVDVTDDECDASCHANIFWMCDVCRDFMQSARCSTLVNAMQVEGSKVERLNMEVCELKNTVNRFIESFQPSREKPVKSAEHRDIKRCSPLSSTKLDIRLDFDSVQENNELDTNTSKSSNERFKLFFEHRE